MQKVYLTRRNLLSLLSKLDRVAQGEQSHCTLVKQDTVHSKYPCSDVIEVTAVEDADYYADRPAGDVHPADEPRKLGSGICAVCSICSGCTKEHFNCMKCECKS